MPSYSIVEEHVVGKVPGRPDLCGDVIATTPGFVAVFGGISENHGRSYDGVAADRFAALTCAEALAEARSGWAAHQMVKFLSERLAERAGEHDQRIRMAHHQSAVVGRPGASAVIWSVARGEVWRVGDCIFAVNGRMAGRSGLANTYAAGLRAAYLEALLLSGYTVEGLVAKDEGRELLMPWLRVEDRLQNLSEARRVPGMNPKLVRGAIDGRAVPADLVEIYEVDSGLGTEIVLASDGYLGELGTLASAEAYLAEVIEEDPLMIRRHPSTTGVTPGNLSFDDRAYIRFTVH